MKTLISLMILMQASLLMSGPAMSATLTVKLINLQNDGGVIRYRLCDISFCYTDNTLPYKEGAVEVRKRGHQFRFEIEDIEPGEYALILYHDKNNNDKLDRNFIGVAKEQRAFSNLVEVPNLLTKYKRMKIYMKDKDRSKLLRMLP